MGFAKSKLIAIGVCCLLLACWTPLLAQFTSGIEGTVTDPSGGVVPGATVTVTNPQTGISRDVLTSDAGFFRITSLAAATYNVSVALPGFKTTTVQNITLETNQTKTVNVSLEIGEAEIEVTVTGAPSEVETSEARVSGFIREENVQELPLVGRNFYSLVVLTPGVTGLPSGGGQAYAQATADIFNAEYGVNLNANGQRAESNNFMIDSAGVNASPRGGVANLTPNADSVQELRVQVNNFSAEYGRNSSAIINVVTKSGSNNFHGTVGWFHTQSILTSRNVFQGEVPGFNRHEVNWSFGGPIWKDRTFFFASMDLLDSGVGISRQTNVVSPEFISFMRANHPDNISTFIMSEFPGKFTPSEPSTLAGPLAGFDCSSLPGGPGSDVETPIGTLPCNFPLVNRGNFSDTVTRDGLQLNGRLDHNWRRGNDRLYINFYRTQRDTVTFASPSVYPEFSPIQPEHTSYVNLNFTHAFGPTLLNEAGVSGMRAWGFAPVNSGFIPQVQVPEIENYGMGFSDATFIQNNIEFRNVLTYIRGEHSFKFGGNYARESGFRGAGAFFGAVWTRPYYGFLNLYDFAMDQPFSQTNLGVDPRTGERSGPSFRPIFDRFSFFVQDDWKVSPHLTINLGLRWETYLRPDTHGQNFTDIVFQGGSTFQERIRDAKAVVKRPHDTTDYNNFAPRIGMAWDPTGEGKMSIRAGIGIFYDRAAGQFYHDCCTYLPIFAITSVSQQTAVKPIYGLSSTTQQPWDFPFPDVDIQVDEKGGIPGLPSEFVPADPNMRTQYSGNWFLGVQYALTPNWTLEANYIGSTGRKLYAIYDVNRFNGDVFDGRLDRVNTSWGLTDYGQANFTSSYNGVNVGLRKRFSEGYDFGIAYTVGKAFDLASSFGRGLPIVNLEHLELNRGLSDFDVRQKVAASLLWEIPSPDVSGFARGLLEGWQLGAVGIFQSGSPYSVRCQQSFIPVYDESGALIGNSGCDYNGDGRTYDFPNAPSFGTFKSGDKSDFINGLFVASDFPAPVLGDDGTLARNSYIGPGYANVDFNMMKKTRVPWFAGEDASLEFRAEFLNLFNRVNLGTPNGSMTSGTFGRSTGTFPARNIQFGLRFFF